MLDPKLIKEKPEIIRNMLKSRAVEFDLEGLIESDQKRREFIIKTDELRKKKNMECNNNKEMYLISNTKFIQYVKKKE